MIEPPAKKAKMDSSTKHKSKEVSGDSFKADTNPETKSKQGTNHKKGNHQKMIKLL